MPGEYEARWISIASGQDPTLHAALRVFGADSRGGDLDVLRDEFADDLADFPKLSDESKLEILVMHDWQENTKTECRPSPDTHARRARSAKEFHLSLDSRTKRTLSGRNAVK